MSEYQATEYVQNYLAMANIIPHRQEGEVVLQELVPRTVKRLLDLGTGDGRLVGLLKVGRPQMQVVAMDFSLPMLQAARERFAGDDSVLIAEGNLEKPLPGELGKFDAVVSSFAIHHVMNERKRALYSEIYRLLQPGGVFYNFEQVSSPTESLHRQFLDLLKLERDDPSNQTLDVETQLHWLRESGFEDVDCFWKWREIALFGGMKSASGMREMLFIEV